jgi:hypothetical protein
LISKVEYSIFSEVMAFEQVRERLSALLRTGRGALEPRPQLVPTPTNEWATDDVMADSMRCSACAKPFGKRDLIGRNGQEYFHLGNNPATLYAGYIDDNGRLIHQFPNNLSLEESMMVDGKGRAADLSKFPPRVREF